MTFVFVALLMSIFYVTIKSLSSHGNSILNEGKVLYKMLNS